MTRGTTGEIGEQIAAQFLRENGYTVLERNLHVGHQELDIVARDAHFLVFVEVKTRTCLYPGAGNYGRPAGAVDREKQKNLLLAARAYLREHPDTGLQPRMDVIEVYLNRATPPVLLKIHHIRNAFLASGG